MAAIPYLSFCSFGSMDCAVGNCRGMPIQAPIDKLGREKGATTSAATLVMVDYHSNLGPGAVIVMRDLPLSKVYQLLEPGPVVLLTTARKGHANIMAMSWHMMVDFEPPLVACIVSNANYSFAALRATKECVIAIPALQLAPKVVAVGNCSGLDMDKFKRFGLTPAPAERVAPPLVAECFANFECKVADTRLVNKYNLFVLEVLKAWTDPTQKNPKTIHHHGYGSFAVDGEMIKLKSKMP
jgi:flavin reductase (DIM6/NTAB) family NADH-FMN oxidoreductase RutF